MYGVPKFQNVRCCIGTIGNAQGLALTLQSVLGQVTRPNEVAIYDCSQSGVGRDFYVQQLIQCATVMGIKVSVISCGNLALDSMYDLMLEDTHDLMWLCNDDVFYDPLCLVELHKTISTQLVAAVCGTKPDITNQRNYKDWTREVRTSAKDKDPPYAFYEVASSVAVKRMHLDLGNALLRTSDIKAKKVKFKVDPLSTTTTFGEDWIFGARLSKAGIIGNFVPTARSFHLDKPSGSPFNPYTTQRQLLQERLVAQDLPLEILDEWGAS